MQEQSEIGHKKDKEDQGCDQDEKKLTGICFMLNGGWIHVYVTVDNSSVQ